MIIERRFFCSAADGLAGRARTVRRTIVVRDCARIGVVVGGDRMGSLLSRVNAKLALGLFVALLWLREYCWDTEVLS